VYGRYHEYGLCTTKVSHARTWPLFTPAQSCTVDSHGTAGGFRLGQRLQDQMPGGLSRGGSSDVAPSKSMGSFTSDFSGSRMRASVSHASSHGPPPISTAAAGTSLLIAVRTCRLHKHSKHSTGNPRIVTNRTNLMTSEHPQEAAHTAHHRCQGAKHGGAHCRKSCMQH
jgi:hypothetical protein